MLDGVPLTSDEINEVLLLGHELRHIEFKGPGVRSDKSYVAVVARAVMAMGNLPDGGHVVLGVAQSGTQLQATGLSDAQLLDWLNHDEVTDAVGRYSDPVPAIDLTVVDLGTAKLIDIQVEPFVDTPYLCRRDWPNLLQVGRMYVRHVGRAETGNPTHHELREILDRAAARRVRSLLSVLGAAGIETLAAGTSAEDKYTEEREAVPGDADRMYFGSHGHWDVKVYAAEFDPDRIPRNDLMEVLQAVTIRLRGWPVPFIPADVLQGRRYIGAEVDERHHVESWRFFPSGQFFERRLFSAETPANKEREAPMVIDVWDVVFHATEVYAFAARLAERLSPVAAMSMSIALDGLYETELRSEPSRALRGTYKTDELRIEVARAVPLPDLIAQPETLAAEAALELLGAFGLHMSREVLIDYQQSLIKR